MTASNGRSAYMQMFSQNANHLFLSSIFKKSPIAWWPGDRYSSSLILSLGQHCYRSRSSTVVEPSASSGGDLDPTAHLASERLASLPVTSSCKHGVVVAVKAPKSVCGRIFPSRVTLEPSRCVQTH